MPLPGFTEVGAGGIFAIMVIREVRSWMKDRNGNGKDKDDKPIIREAIRDELKPYLERNQEALQAIRDNTTKLAYVAERFWK